MPKKPPLPPPDPEAKPWEPRPHENIQHWRWFIKYRDQVPPRSMARVAREAGKSVTWISKIAVTHDWTARVQAWDVTYHAAVSRKLDEMQADAIEAMRTRHINLGMGMQTAAARELQAWIHKIELAKAKAVEQGREHHDPVLTIGELIRLANEGTSMERLNRGEPTDVTRVEDTGGADLERLSKDELKELQRLKRKIKGQ